MSDTYTKLFRSIAASTIVSEPLATRWLWVTMLSQADKAGKVYASVPGLARMANISLAECEEGLRCFLSPDPYSRTSEHEGRRVEVIDGGWRLLNHAKYDAMRNEAERREKKREWDRKNRPSGHQRAKAAESDTHVETGQSDGSPTQSDETRQSGPISHSSFLISQEDQERNARAQDERVVCWQSIVRTAGYGPGQAGNASDPRLTTAIEAGVTAEQFRAVATEAAQFNPAKPFAWVIATALGRHRDASQSGANHADRPQRGRVGLADRHPRPVPSADDAIPGEAVRIHA